MDYFLTIAVYNEHKIGVEVCGQKPEEEDLWADEERE